MAAHSPHRSVALVSSSHMGSPSSSRTSVTSGREEARFSSPSSPSALRRQASTRA